MSNESIRQWTDQPEFLEDGTHVFDLNIMVNDCLRKIQVIQCESSCYYITISNCKQPTMSETLLCGIDPRNIFTALNALSTVGGLDLYKFTDFYIVHNNDL